MCVMLMNVLLGHGWGSLRLFAKYMKGGELLNLGLRLMPSQSNLIPIITYYESLFADRDLNDNDDRHITIPSHGIGLDLVAPDPPTQSGSNT
jgi:hypothetical protein